MSDAARRPPRLLLVTGMSGAGKSTVLDALEDMGWDVVDTLPVDLLEGFVQGEVECRTVPAAPGSSSVRASASAHWVAVPCSP